MTEAKASGSRQEDRRPQAIPSFSLIVAAYQVADLIGEALDSALAQTFAPLEIIVCNDGSDDDLASALVPYRDRIVLLEQDHCGVAIAKNAAIRAASSEFFAILDPDDVYLPGRLEALAELSTARPELDILTTDAYLETDGRLLGRNYTRKWTFETHDQRREILRRNFIFGLAAVRRSRFLAIGGFDEQMVSASDWDAWIRMILSGSRAGMVDEPLAVYRLREGSLSSRRSERLRWRLFALEKATLDPTLLSDEHAILQSSIASHERALELTEHRSALLESSADARAQAASIALDSQHSMRARLLAAASVVAPQTIGRLLRRGAARSWTAAGGIRIRR